MRHSGHFSVISSLLRWFRDRAKNAARYRERSVWPGPSCQFCSGLRILRIEEVRAATTCPANSDLVFGEIGGLPEAVFVTASILDAQLAEELLRRRSSTTGGWGYTSDQLAVEPTALTLVALWSWNRWNGPRDWLQPLRSAQLPDGQWPMIASDERGSPWATALAAIALLRLSSPDNVLERALVSLVRSEPKEAFWLWRLKFRAQDKHVRFDPTKYGWAWVPGTVSWVIPTAMALIALEPSGSLLETAESLNSTLS
jgi:hypothetical protein